MKYVVADSDSNISTITSNPTLYISKFEPIDVTEGKMIAWDERGTFYHFEPHNLPSSSPSKRSISVVDVGKWGDGEPLLVKVADSNLHDLKKALVNYLEGNARPKKYLFWFRSKKVPFVKVDHSLMSIPKLITEVERAFAHSTTKAKISK